MYIYTHIAFSFQVEMIGHNVYDFSHPYDHEEIKTFLSSISSTEQKPVKEKETLSLFVRMKSTLKSKGKTVNLKSATYQVISSIFSPHIHIF